MRGAHATHQLFRSAWGLPGALACAALTFVGFFMRPGLNTDTVAPLVFAFVLAVGGLLVGMVMGELLGGVLNRWLVQYLPGPLWAAHVATLLLSAVVWWGVWSVGRYHVLPAWLAQPKAVPTRSTPLPTPAQPQVSACQLPPPADARARKSWDEECR